MVQVSSLPARFGNRDLAVWRDHRLVDRRWRHADALFSTLAVRVLISMPVSMPIPRQVSVTISVLLRAVSWLAPALGNTTYFILIMSTSGKSFRYSVKATPWPPSWPSSVILWSNPLHGPSGIMEAAFINQVAFIAKIVPIFLIIIMISPQERPVYRQFLGGGDYGPAEIFNQVRSTMLVTVFVFIGTEGQCTPAMRRNGEDVGWATVLGRRRALPVGAGDPAPMGSDGAGAGRTGVSRPWPASPVRSSDLGHLVRQYRPDRAGAGGHLAWSSCGGRFESAAKASFVPNALGYENQNQVPSTAPSDHQFILVQVFLIVTRVRTRSVQPRADMTSAKTLIPHALVAALRRQADRNAGDLWAGIEGSGTRHDLGDTCDSLCLLHDRGRRAEVRTPSCIIFAPGTLLFILPSGAAAANLHVG